MAGVGATGFTTIVDHEYSVKFGRNDMTLSLTDDGITFTLLNKKKTWSVEWSDLLTVAPIPAGCKKPQGPGVNIFYINRAKTDWKREQVFVKTSDEPQATSIAEKMTKIFQEKVYERPKHLLIIINPKSGGCKGVSIYSKVAHLFELANIRTQVVVTERAGHAIEYLKQNDLSSYDGLVAVGGDGTLTECISGLSQAACAKDSLQLNDLELEIPYLNMRVGIIPAGTGQGMAMMTSGSINLENCALHIIKGCSWHLDLFTLHNGHKYLNTGCLLTGFGMTSEMIRKSEANRQMGRARYLYAIVSTGLKPPLFYTDVEVLKPGENGNPPEWVSLSGQYINVGHFHADFFSKKIHDGSFYVGLFRDTSMFSIARLFMTMKSLKIAERVPDWLDYYPALCYKIKPYSGALPNGRAASNAESSSNSLPFPSVNIDGDSYVIDATQPIQVKLQPRKIRFFGCYPYGARAEELAATSEEGAAGISQSF